MQNPAQPSETAWLAIVVSVPSDDPATRMRILRTLEALGTAVLREGVYMLPRLPGNLQAAERLSEYVHKNGGQATVLHVSAGSEAQQTAFKRLFDRAARYDALLKVVESLYLGFEQADPASIARVLRKQRREFDAIRALDFFPNEARDRVQKALDDADLAARKRLFPAQRADAPTLLEEGLLGRTWVTRRPLWADRLASAWLIRRFVDPEATIQWLEKADAIPADALGFGFEGARFSNSAQRVTFEEILSMSALAEDAALIRIGTIVNYLEVGGRDVPEAAGVETLLQGAIRRSESEDALLQEAEKTFDLLYEAYLEAPRA